MVNYRALKTRTDAKTSTQALIAYLKKKLEKEGEQRAAIGDVTVGEFARDMFTDGAAHIKRWKEKGYVLKPQTVDQYRRHLVNHLFPVFKNVPLDKIRPAQVEDFLLEQRLSNSSRNSILYTLKLVMQEAKREGIIDMVPEFESFKRSSKRQNVLSGEELDRNWTLFFQMMKKS